MSRESSQQSQTQRSPRCWNYDTGNLKSIYKFKLLIEKTMPGESAMIRSPTLHKYYTAAYEFYVNVFLGFYNLPQSVNKYYLVKTKAGHAQVILYCAISCRCLYFLFMIDFYMPSK